MLWFYSKERSAGTTWGTFLGVAFILAVIDVTRWEDSIGGLIGQSAIIPLIYFAVFILGPLVAPSLNESKPVPERVT